MIRPFTALCAVLAGASGLYLYTEKHRTTVLDAQISNIVQDTQHIREHTAMLRAEWALLNQPDRLHALSTRFLPDLQPMAPNQFVQMAALSRRLPEVAAAPSAPTEAPAATSTAAPVDTTTALAPMQATALAPIQATALAPIQIMASRMVASTGNLPAASRRISQMMQPASPANANDGRRHAVPGRGHVPSRMAPFKLADEARPVPSRPMLPPTMQASRTVAYEGSPLRSLISTQGAYAHPYPMRTAWRTVAQATTPAQATGSRSSLGFSHAALPAPVPLVGN